MSTTITLAYLWANFRELIPVRRKHTMLPINANTLWAIAPHMNNPTQHARQTEIIEPLDGILAATLDKAGINTPLRVAHFLGQCCAESDGFRAVEEYASGAGYEGRSDLGNVFKGDGPRYKGRGLIELTGRDNYTRYGHLLGIDLATHPEMAATPDVSLKIACAYWTQHNLNRLADADNLIAVTRAINGGLNGIEQRRTYLASAKRAMQQRAAQDMATVQAPGANEIAYRGMTGPFVEQLQDYLRHAGYPVALDGDFGPGTETALKMFQEANGLKADGIAGARTWAALREATNAKG